MQTPFRIGERLYLRPLEQSDIDRCVRWINNPDVADTLAVKFPINRKREQEWLDSLYKDDKNTVLGIVKKEDDKHIGNCGLHGIDPVNRHAEFGVMIGEKDEWGKGYAPEAARLMLGYGFDELGLHRIGLEVYSHNKRAQRVYEKAGFVHEGVMREAQFCGGKFRDSLVMSVLESEWRKGERSEG